MINKNENRLFSIEEAASLLEIDKEKLISYMKQICGYFYSIRIDSLFTYQRNN